MKKSYEYIRNFSKLTRIFKKWPSFHDAEVLEINLNREGPCIELKIHIFTTSRTLDEKGCFERKNNFIVAFNFLEIEDLILNCFNSQNVIADINIRYGKHDEIIIVEINSIYGVYVKFSCKKAKITSVEKLVDI